MYWVGLSLRWMVCWYRDLRKRAFGLWPFCVARWSAKCCTVWLRVCAGSNVLFVQCLLLCLGATSSAHAVDCNLLLRFYRFFTPTTSATHHRLNRLFWRRARSRFYMYAAATGM